MFHSMVNPLIYCRILLNTLKMETSNYMNEELGVDFAVLVGQVLIIVAEAFSEYFSCRHSEKDPYDIV